MTEFDILNEINKDYSQISASNYIIGECYRLQNELEFPTLLPEKKAKDFLTPKLHITKKLWYVFIFLLSIVIFYFIIEPFLFPVLVNNISWFSDYASIPNSGDVLSLYIFYFLAALIIPILIDWEILPQYGGRMTFAMIIMSILLFILSIIFFIILELLIRSDIIIDPSTELVAFIDLIDNNFFIPVLHLFIIGIYSSIISKFVFKRRYKRISDSEKKVNLTKSQKLNNSLRDKYFKELKKYDDIISQEEDKISLIEKKIKKHPYYDVLNKEPAGFYHIMDFFSQKRIVSIEEGNYLYKLEKNNYEAYKREEKNISSHLNTVLSHNKSILKEINDSLESVKSTYDSISSRQAMDIHKREVFLDKIKYK